MFVKILTRKDWPSFKSKAGFNGVSKHAGIILSYINSLKSVHSELLPEENNN